MGVRAMQVVPHISSRRRRLLAALGAMVTSALMVAGLSAVTVANAQVLVGQAQVSGSRLALFAAAAKEFGVPDSILLAVGYNESRWESHGGSPSVDGGYGFMDLTTRTFPAEDGRGDPAHPAPRYISVTKTHYTLDEAARLLHVPSATLKASDRQNIRGAAAVLASYARKLNGGALPSSPNDWYGAIAEYSGDTTAQAARSFADDVFATMRGGSALITSDGQVMRLGAVPGVQPDHRVLGALGLRSDATFTPAQTRAAVDCPRTANCQFVPAAYTQDDPSDPTNYGNYDLASRPADMKIDYIIIHDTEGSYDGTIATFQNPATYVSANYVIRSSDGAITEMVRPQNVSWGAGDWYINMHAINIEHEGIAAQGGIWYTEAMYRSSALLVRYLAAKYDIPLDRAHILGHDDLPGPSDFYTSIQHWDPGPFWNWNHYMALLHGVSDKTEQALGGAAAGKTGQIVTISPDFARNQPPVTDCSSGTCVPLPAQPASFVYLHSAPSSSSPLLSDPELHPDGSPGTTQDSDWSATASAGEKYVAAGRQGDWTGIWYGGQAGWFYNPAGPGRTTKHASGEVITPKPGLTSIPVYGSAYPEVSAYPPAVPVPLIAPLTYIIPAGQEYVTSGTVPTDYYYAPTIDSSLPDDHTVITGGNIRYQISFNHRHFFVNASDVTVKHLT